MLLRNINQTAGLCDGTRLIVTELVTGGVEAGIITSNKGFYCKDINVPYRNKMALFVREINSLRNYVRYENQ